MNRITVTSGWETPLPEDMSIFDKFMGIIDIEDIYDTVHPSQCQAAYQNLLYFRKKLTTIFDWRKN